MKIRTDFVTNSSSSSFVASIIKTRAGKEYTIDIGDTEPNVYAIPRLKENTLVYNYEGKSHEILTISDLLACIYFSRSDEALPFKAITLIFAFLMDGLSAKSFVSKIKKVEGFEDMDDIDPSDYFDDEEMKEEVLDYLTEILADFACEIDITDECELEEYKNILNSLGGLDEIESIAYDMTENFWGEEMTEHSETFRNNLDDALAKKSFSAVEVNAPSYNETFDYWLNALENDVLMGNKPMSELPALLVKRALQSGNPYDMLPETITGHQGVRLEIPENIKKSAIQSASGAADKFVFDEVNDIQFAGKTFVLTGHTAENERKLTSVIESKGGIVKGSLVVKTDYLIVNEDYKKGITTKFTRAMEMKASGKNVIIINTKTFYGLVENKPLLSNETPAQQAVDVEPVAIPETAKKPEINYPETLTASLIYAKEIISRNKNNLEEDINQLIAQKEELEKSEKILEEMIEILRK